MAYILEHDIFTGALPLLLLFKVDKNNFMRASGQTAFIYIVYYYRIIM